MEGSLGDVDGLVLPKLLSEVISTRPEELLWCVEKIAEAGGGAWLVGGAVRQGMIGRKPNDWDLAVDLEPEHMLELFPDALATGVRYGTVTLRRGEYSFEATTLRGEGHYGDGRRPDSVSYSKSLAADLARRDFTFNAMAVDLARELLHDPFEGRIDLANQRLRAVGDPVHRLGEDGLRIMRAYRFLDLGDGMLCKPDHSLEKALVRKQYMIENVSKERVWDEFKRILSGDSVGMILHRMAEDGLLNRILPGNWHSQESCIAAQRHPCLNGIEVEARLALLLKESDYDSIEPGLRELKMSNAQIAMTLALRRRLGSTPLEEAEGILRRYRAVLGESRVSQLNIDRALANAFDDSREVEFDDFIKRINNLPRLTAGDKSLVDGLWLMDFTGMPQGRRLGRLKEWLHLLQVERDLGDISEIESLLCTLSWQHGDELSWPRLAWP
jgi:tRNA nucleotidyltransferase/poly(A) polymerase